MSEMGPISVRSPMRWRMISWPAANGIAASRAAPMHTDVPGETNRAMASDMGVNFGAVMASRYSTRTHVSLRDPAPSVAGPDPPRHGARDVRDHARHARQPPRPDRRGRQSAVARGAEEPRRTLWPRQ